jgi:TatD DNase family protein
MYFNLHTHHFTGNGEILELVNQYPDEFDDTVPYFSIGIHPWRIVAQRLEQDLQVIESKLSDKHCLALGECGLDKRIETPLETQIEVFETQLRFAEKFRKPVVLHCVAAYQEVIDAKKRLEISVPMIIHGFSKNEQVAKQLLDNGFYLSFGKYLLRNPELESVFKLVPDNRFFLETDMIDETICDVYDLAAKYKNVTIEKLQETINTNFETVFKTNNQILNSTN